MFSDNLTDNLLRICCADRLSYETAAERCEISACYFGRIVRKKVSPSLRVLERLCDGLQLTPNELLGFPDCAKSEYRTPMPVAWVQRPDAYAACSPVCPRCRAPLQRERPNYCCDCGQALEWGPEAMGHMR